MAKVEFTYVPVQPTQVCNFVWEQAFSNYLLQRKQFPLAIARQEALLKALVDDIGLRSNDGDKILAAMSEKAKLVRRWHALQKVPNVLAILEPELRATEETGDKIVILATSSNALMELRDGLALYGSVLIFPGTPLDKRTYVVKRFQQSPKCRVLVADARVAGKLGDLTMARKLAVVEPAWNAVPNVEAVMRLANWRQNADVAVRFFGLADTIDEKIVRFLCTATKQGVNGFVAQGQHTPSDSSKSTSGVLSN